jgi:hypothetical protein
MIAFKRLLLFLLLALDWAADPSLVAPAVEPLSKPWCNTENFCPSRGYQQAVLQQSLPDQGSACLGPAADSAAPESAVDSVKTFSAIIPVRHLYVFMSLRR